MFRRHGNNYLCDTTLVHVNRVKLVYRCHYTAYVRMLQNDGNVMIRWTHFREREFCMHRHDWSSYIFLERESNKHLGLSVPRGTHTLAHTQTYTLTYGQTLNCWRLMQECWLCTEDTWSVCLIGDTCGVRLLSKCMFLNCGFFRIFVSLMRLALWVVHLPLWRL